MYVYIVISAVARDMAPAFVELYYHAHALRPMLAAAMHRCFKHTLFAPCSPGRHSSMILLTEIKSAFVKAALGIGRHTAVAVGLFQISAYLFEIRLISMVFGPLEIIHHHWPYGHGCHSEGI